MRLEECLKSELKSIWDSLWLGFLLQQTNFSCSSQLLSTMCSKNWSFL